MDDAAFPVAQSTVRVDAQGRIVLPAAVRDRFHWTSGSVLHLRIDDGGVTLRDPAAILAEIRALGAPLRAAGYSLDQFLREKAEDSAAEEEDEQQRLRRRQP